MDKKILKKKILWWTINPAVLAMFFCGVIYDVVWCQNIVKFLIGFNCVIFLMVALAGKETWKTVRGEGVAFTLDMNTAYGLVFATSLAAFGWFGYAALEATTMVIQNAILFGDISEEPNISENNPD